MQFNYPKQLKLAHTPTPIQQLGNLSLVDSSTNIFIKRDDLTGSSLSGNKVRKLEFLVAEAQTQGADTLITCGGIQSNHARATAVAAAQLGMRSHLVLRGDSNSELEGNLLLDRMLGSEITFVTKEQYSTQRAEIMQNIVNDLSKEGRKGYIIPEGGSNALGAWGYISATEEIVKQLAAEKVKIDAIVAATGSGGTLAGLILGKTLFNQIYDVIGINVCDDAQYFKTEINNIFQDFQQRFKLPLNLSADDVKIIEGYVGEGYSISTRDELVKIQQVAQQTGIILDPTYTGKGFIGLLDQIKQQRFVKNANILFLHSGGIFGLFPKKNQLASLL
jgi:D-cysteine desulfhydrase